MVQVIKYMQECRRFQKKLYFFANSMLTIIRKVILDNLMQKEIEFILGERKK